MPIYLGFDSSTQGLTATVLEVGGAARRVLFSRVLPFDERFPQYGTRHGALPSPDDPRTVHAPPLLWAEALETAIAELVRTPGVDWRQLRAVSGSAQQHGSVYLTAAADEGLGRLTPGRPLAVQLEPLLARDTSPIWMDSSTTAQCRAIEAALGGPAAVARLTGSRAFERFTGPQIRKLAEEDPACYARTARIHLVSSWLASLLAGRHAPIDHADGSGMNLMDIARKVWSPGALRATAPGLGDKLPPLADPAATLGTLSPYWRARYNLPPARIVAWSGDNPCSLVGAGVVHEGQIVVSLGTSDTIFGLMSAPRVGGDGTGHVFAATTGGYMAMTVFKNGSLARERVRDGFGLDWAGFSGALRSTPAGNGGGIMLPWFDPEITPPVLEPGVRRFGMAADDAGANVRGAVEAQMLAMARHSRWMGVPVAAIRATGGAARNADILQVMADVFGVPVDRVPAGNSAALGAALRAFHGDRLADGAALSWNDVVEGFTVPEPGSRVDPIPDHVEIYRRLAPEYAAREREALQQRT